MNSTSSCSAK